LTTGPALLAFSSRFGFGLRCARPLSSWGTGAWSFLADAGAARTLGSRAARADSSAHTRLATDTAEQTGLGLFNDFDFRVIAVYAQVGEGSVSRLFD
jgi:hypothetical protein